MLSHNRLSSAEPYACPWPSAVKRVLVVDDDCTILQIVGSMLGHMGIPNDIVGSGAEALRRLERDRYDAVITDWIMPGMGGIELAGAMKERDANLAVILMTGYRHHADVDAIPAQLVDCLLFKPFQAGELKAALKHCLGEFSIPAPMW